MGRDDPLLRRLFGRAPPPPGAGPPGEPPRYGIVPALWIGGLLLLILASALTALGAAALALWTSPHEQDLRAWGVVEVGEEVWLYHDHSAARDGSSGCLAVGERLVRWDDRRPSGSLVLTGATVDYTLHPRARVVVSRAGEAITCPFRIGEGADRFAGRLRMAASKTPRESWGPGRTDPRL